MLHFQDSVGNEILGQPRKFVIHGHKFILRTQHSLGLTIMSFYEFLKLNELFSSYISWITLAGQRSRIPPPPSPIAA